MYISTSLIVTAAFAGSAFAVPSYPAPAPSGYTGDYTSSSVAAVSSSASEPAVYPTSSAAAVSSSASAPASYPGYGSSSSGYAISSSAVPSSYPAPSASSQSTYSVQPTGYTWSAPPSSPSPPSGPPHGWPGHPGSYPGGAPPAHGWEHQPGSYPGSYPSGPSSGSQCPGVEPGKYCLSDSDAEEAADIFRELIQNYSDELALAALTEDFIDYSSAVNIIRNGGDGEPFEVEKPTFVGRQAFMDGQGSQPEIPFKKLQRFHGCDSVSMRWLTRRSANGQETETARIPVVGNVIIEVVESSPEDQYNFRIKTIFSEFNSAAWLVNLGRFVPENGTEGDAGTKRSVPANLAGPMF